MILFIVLISLMEIQGQLSPFEPYPNDYPTALNCTPVHATLSGGPGVADYAQLPLPKGAAYYGHQGGYVDPDLLNPQYYGQTNDILGQELWYWEQSFRPVCQSTCACLHNQLVIRNPYHVFMQIWTPGWLNPARVNMSSLVVHCFEAGVYTMNTTFPAPLNNTWYVGCPNSIINVQNVASTVIFSSTPRCSPCSPSHFMFNGLTFDLSLTTITQPFLIGLPGWFMDVPSNMIMFNNTVRNLPFTSGCNPGSPGLIQQVVGPVRLYENIFFNQCGAFAVGGNSLFIGRNWFVNVNDAFALISGTANNPVYWYYIYDNKWSNNALVSTRGGFYTIMGLGADLTGNLCAGWINGNIASLGTDNASPFYLVTNADSSNQYDNCPVGEFSCVWFTNNTVIANGTGSFGSDFGNAWAWVLKNNTFVSLGTHVASGGCPSPSPWALETVVSSIFANNSYFRGCTPPSFLPPQFGVMNAFSAGGGACHPPDNVCGFLAPLTFNNVNQMGPEWYYAANDSVPNHWYLSYSGPGFGTKPYPTNGGEDYPYGSCCAPGGPNGPCCVPGLPTAGRTYPCHYGNTKYWLQMSRDEQVQMMEKSIEEQQKRLYKKLQFM